MKGLPRIAVAALAVLLVLGSAGARVARADGPVTVLLNWRPTSLFGAFYVAQDQKLYDAAGLRVALTHQRAEVATLDQFEAEREDIGVASPFELVAARARGAHVTAVAAISQRSPIVFISKAEYGIVRPAQIVGQTVRVTSEMAPVLDALLVAEGLPPRSWTPASLASDIDLFLTGPARVWGVYASGLAQQLAESGHAINTIYPEDYGLALYGTVIFVRDELLQRDPARVKAFVRATLDGLTLAMERPELAVAGTLARDPYANPGTERERFYGALPLFRGRRTPPGAMDDATWANVIAVARQADLAVGDLKPADLYTTGMLP